MVARLRARRSLVFIPNLKYGTCFPFLFLKRRKTRRHSHFLQKEGFAQGCPLSPVFACLVLSLLLKPLNAELRKRANSRPSSGCPSDDNKGSMACSSSYLDDTQAVLAYADLPWFLQKFQTLGAPLAIRLNLHKTKILTSLTDESPSTHLSPDDASHLNHALSILDPEGELNPKILGGTRLLGQPVGGPEFQKKTPHPGCRCL